MLRSGRFDYILPFSLPDAADRAAILKLCCRRVPLDSAVDFDELAAETEGLTGADIESLCKKATLSAIVEFQHGARLAPFVVMKNDFLAILGSNRGSRQGKIMNERIDGVGNFPASAFSNTRY